MLVGLGVELGLQAVVDAMSEGLVLTWSPDIFHLRVVGLKNPRRVDLRLTSLPGVFVATALPGRMPLGDPAACRVRVLGD